MQYFVVNEKLEKLNVVFYDPRNPYVSFFIIPVYRVGNEERIAYLFNVQIGVLAEVENFVSLLTTKQ